MRLRLVLVLIVLLKRLHGESTSDNITQILENIAEGINNTSIIAEETRPSDTTAQILDHYLGENANNAEVIVEDTQETHAFYRNGTNFKIKNSLEDNGTIDESAKKESSPEYNFSENSTMLEEKNVLDMISSPPDSLIATVSPQTDTKINGIENTTQNINTLFQSQNKTREKLKENDIEDDLSNVKSSKSDYQNADETSFVETEAKPKNMTEDNIVEIKNISNTTEELPTSTKISISTAKNVTVIPISPTTPAITSTTQFTEDSPLPAKFNFNYLYFLFLLVPIGGILFGIIFYLRRKRRTENEEKPKDINRSNNRRHSTPSWVFSDAEFDEELTTLKEGE